MYRSPRNDAGIIAVSKPTATPWHTMAVSDVGRALATDLSHGLSPEQAAARLASDGRNELQRKGAPPPLAILVSQFRSVVVAVLIVAAVVSAAVGDVIESGAILAIVVLNAILGFVQEYRAERAIAALARLTAPRARVLRGGRAAEVPAVEVVRGDLLLLEAGDLVAADARLVDATALHAAEAALTGESAPVAKAVHACAADTALADRTSMVFLGTSITRGTGRAIVAGTGMATEIGRIAALLDEASSGGTPLQHKLDQVARRLLVACLAIVTLVFALGVLRAIPPLEMFLAAVSLAVAAVPESLPAVVTIALALGVQRMARRGALVRRLPAVETLGSADVICTDKTGTLTLGEMTVRRVVTASGVYTVTGEGYATEGDIFAADGSRAASAAALRALLTAAVACVDAELTTRDGRPSIVGDPTEGALLVAAAKAGIARTALEGAMPRVAAIPFDSDRKRMTVIRRDDGATRVFVKGAPEVILERCTMIRTDEGVVPISERARGAMLEACALLAADALRVLALAERTLDGSPAGADAIERELTLLGLAGLQDPPRAEAREAVERCKRAGIRTVMITGDHPDTARAIARELGILTGGDEVIVGRELDMLDDAALAGRVRSAAVYARVTAEHKLRIVRAWKAQGAVVAMTGDGVNDAPALEEAAIGIAMGTTGTEVTKEAADMVITDDNFASIVSAIEEGRGVYDNIERTLAYLLSGNAGELGVMLVAALMGWPLPLLPIQLLWINLVTDGLPALALATEPPHANVLARPPRHRDAALMDRHFFRRIVFVGGLSAGVTLAAFVYELRSGDGIESARNAAFAVLVIDQLLRSLGARSATRTVWELGILSNLRLALIVVASFALQIVIQHAPVFEGIFRTEPITLARTAVWTVIGALPFFVLEATKILTRRRR